MPGRFLSAAVHIAERAGRMLLKHHRGSFRVMHKAERVNLVTNLDTESETLIARFLRGRFPDHDLVGEEKERPLTGSPFRWYIDPLDGTVNYVHGMPLFAVSIGLTHGGRPLCGAVFAPAMGLLFTGLRGRGARRNGRPIRVSDQGCLRDGLIATGFPYSEAGRRRQMRHFGRFTLATQAIRRLGCASLDLCFVADGIFDGFWEIGLHPWDLAAGALIIEEAGGRVTDFSGRRLDLDRSEVVASNGRLHRAMIRTVGKPR
jgi:myo-inositol-1(or 4)-monophosphatase